MSNALVKCSECGYLALRTRNARSSGLPIFVETPEAVRVRGVMPVPEADYLSKPVCFVRWPAFIKEVEAATDSTVPEIITKERSCRRFLKWDQGFTPKEHWEMNFQERTERKRKNGLIIQTVAVTVASALVSAAVSLFLNRSDDPAVVTPQAIMLVTATPTPDTPTATSVPTPVPTLRSEEQSSEPSPSATGGQ